MKTNTEGLTLIALFTDEYEASESRTASEKAISLYVTARLNSNQFSALVSLVMGIGIAAFSRSKLLRHINVSANNPAALSKAIDEWSSYVYEFDDRNERVLDPFLVEQRKFEIALFLKPETVKKRRAK